MNRQSIRRVALRSVASAARASAPKAPSSQFASQFVAKNVIKLAAVPFARYFSQSMRMMNENESSNVEAQTQEQAQPPAAQQQTDPRELPFGIWVRNFVFDVNEDHLVELFSKYGNVVSAKVVRDPRGLSRGFGFVYMNSNQEVEEAIAELNGSFWHGRRVHMEKQTGDRKVRPSARPARNDGPSEPTRYLYIGNIPYEATDAELNNLFRGLDNLEDVRVAVDRVTGFPRGFAHADFISIEAAQAALEKLSGIELGGRSLRVDFAGSTQPSRRRGERGERGGRNDRGDRSERPNRQE